MTRSLLFQLVFALMQQLGPYEVYSKKFLERNIGGLQLMEISPPDLAAMGIHNPTEQEKITEIIDSKSNLYF